MESSDDEIEPASVAGTSVPLPEAPGACNASSGLCGASFVPSDGPSATLLPTKKGKVGRPLGSTKRKAEILRSFQETEEEKPMRRAGDRAAAAREKLAELRESRRRRASADASNAAGCKSVPEAQLSADQTAAIETLLCGRVIMSSKATCDEHKVTPGWLRETSYVIGELYLQEEIKGMLELLAYLRAQRLKPVLFVHHRQYDETPQKARVASDCDPDSATEIAKVLAAEHGFAMLLQRESDGVPVPVPDTPAFVFICGDLSGALRAMHSQTAENILATARSIAWLHESVEREVQEMFPRLVQGATTDQHGGVIKAERLFVREKRAHWISLQGTYCQPHRVHTSLQKTVRDMVPSLESFLVNVGLVFRQPGVLRDFREAAKGWLKAPRRLVIQQGPPPYHVRMWRATIFRLFLDGKSFGDDEDSLPSRESSRRRRPQRALIFETLFNGDLRDKSHVWHFCGAGSSCPGCLDANSALSKMVNEGLDALLPAPPRMYPRKSWLGADDAIDDIAVLELCHGLLSAVLPQVLGKRCREPDAEGHLLPVQRDPEPDVGVALAVQPSAGSNAREARVVLDDLEPATFEYIWAQLVVVREVVGTLNNIMCDFLARSSSAWDAQQDLQRSHGEEGGFRLACTFQGRSTEKALGVFSQMLTNANFWELVPAQARVDPVFASESLRLISRAGAAVHALLRAPTKLYPYKLCGLLLNDEDRSPLAFAEEILEEQCLWDQWTAAHVCKFPSIAELLSKESIAEIVTVAWKWLDTNMRVERGHSGVRRVAHTQDHHGAAQDLRHMSKFRLTRQQQAANRTWVGKVRQAQAACSISRPPCGKRQALKLARRVGKDRKFRGGGAARAFIRATVHGRLATRADWDAYRALAPEQRERYILEGKLATQRRREGARSWSGVSRGLLVPPAEGAKVSALLKKQKRKARAQGVPFNLDEERERARRAANDPWQDHAQSHAKKLRTTATQEKEGREATQRALQVWSRHACAGDSCNEAPKILTFDDLVPVPAPMGGAEAYTWQLDLQQRVRVKLPQALHKAADFAAQWSQRHRTLPPMPECKERSKPLKRCSAAHRCLCDPASGLSCRVQTPCRQIGFCVCKNLRKGTLQTLVSRVYGILRQWNEQPVFKRRMAVAEWVLSLRASSSGKEVFWLVALQYWKPAETTCLSLQRVHNPQEGANQVTLQVLQVPSAIGSDESDPEFQGRCCAFANASELPDSVLLWQSLASAVLGFEHEDVSNLTLRAWRPLAGAPTGAPPCPPQRLVVSLEDERPLHALALAMVEPNDLDGPRQDLEDESEGPVAEPSMDAQEDAGMELESELGALLDAESAREHALQNAEGTTLGDRGRDVAVICDGDGDLHASAEGAKVADEAGGVIIARGSDREGDVGSEDEGSSSSPSSSSSAVSAKSSAPSLPSPEPGPEVRARPALGRRRLDDAAIEVDRIDVYEPGCSIRLGIIRYKRQDHTFYAKCEKCGLRVTRAAGAGPRQGGNQGRPLGFLAAWCAFPGCCAGDPSHHRDDLAMWIAHERRLSFRRRLAEESSWEAMSAHEREPRDGEGEEPVDFF